MTPPIWKKYREEHQPLPIDEMLGTPAESQSLLSGTALKTLLDAYRDALQDMEHLSESVTAKDFKAFSKARDDARRALEEYVERLRGERLLMAMLASDKPQFDNPLVAWHAQSLRDKLLEELSGRSTESGVPK